jgi:hypothetical protein
MRGSVQFYLVGGKASLAKVVKIGTKALLKFSDSVLPADYSERAMRERAFKGVLDTLAMNALPEAVAAALATAENVALEALTKTPFVSGLAVDQRSERLAAIKELIHKNVMSIDKNASMGLPKLRASVLASLARHKQVPFFFGGFEGLEKPLDFEANLVGILGDAVTTETDKSSALERKTAALALATFAGRDSGCPAIQAVSKALVISRGKAQDNASRELLESLVETLKSANAECAKL